jgi:hypothetical protein
MMPVSKLPLVCVNATLRRLGNILGFTSPRSARSPSNKLLEVENKALTLDRWPMWKAALFIGFCFFGMWGALSVRYWAYKKIQEKQENRAGNDSE